MCAKTSVLKTLQHTCISGGHIPQPSKEFLLPYVMFNIIKMEWSFHSAHFNSLLWLDFYALNSHAKKLEHVLKGSSADTESRQQVGGARHMVSQMLDCCMYSLDWTTGMDYWTHILSLRTDKGQLQHMIVYSTSACSSACDE